MGTTEQWFVSHTFHHHQFDDPAALLRSKQEQDLRLSLCIPTLNEAATIAGVVEAIRPLRDQIPLLDEIAVIDSGSNDQTCRIAASAGADVYVATEILPELEPMVGKGENLWKALYQLRGDIIIFIDGDILNLHTGFVTGLVGPLLLDAELGYVKGFYARPGHGVPQGAGDASDSGGRMTEILVRPLLSLFFPSLARFIQPLAGEYAARRSLLERIAFPVGYGVELAHLLDLSAACGLDVFAQTDLGERRHRYRCNRQQGQSAFGVLQVFFRRLYQQGRMVGDPGPEHMPALIQFVRSHEGFRAEEFRLPEPERPPLTDLKQYRLRHRGCTSSLAAMSQHAQEED